MLMVLTALVVICLFLAAGFPATSSAPTSYGRVSSVLGIIVLLPVVCLAICGGVAWFGSRGYGLAVLALGTATAWLAPEIVGLEGAPPSIRSVALLVAPFVVPLALQLTARAVGADRPGTSTRRTLGGLYVLVALLSIARSVTYDPFFDVHCWSICQGNILAIVQDPGLASLLEATSSVLAICAGVGLIVWACRRLRSPPSTARRRQATILAPAIVMGAAIAWWALARLVVGVEDPRDPRLLGPAVATALAVAGLGVGIAWSMGEVTRRANAVRRIADAIDPGSENGGLRVILSRTLGDFTVRVAYPLADGPGFVDDQGIAVPVPRVSPGRAITTIEREGEPVALVDHDAGLDPEALSHGIGAAARLAVDNERLEAATKARLRELQASRSRIVEEGDAARGRLERDLHDGAQQRLLALSYELRLAAGAARDAPVEMTTALGEVIDEVDRALLELRELAHGIHPIDPRRSGPRCRTLEPVG